MRGLVATCDRIEMETQPRQKIIYCKNSLLEVFPHLLELDAEPLEPHELVGDALREGPDGGVLDVPEEVLDADL